ncbi:TPA: glycosyltransferase [Streptococcus suis]
MKISVIMGVYNAVDTLSEAIDSILGQTFQDFEFIICDDGSKDTSLLLLKKYQQQFPDKIKLIINEKNKGLNETLNDCLKVAEGEYIARMDADDLSLPTRFEKQVAFLDANPDFAFVGTNMIHFDENGDWGESTLLAEPRKEDLVKGSTFAHATVLMRKAAVMGVSGYSVSSKLLRVEDYHLWIKLYEKGLKGHNLTESLYKVRDDKDAQGRRTVSNRLNEVYVKCLAIRHLNLSLMNYIYVLKPLFLIIIPSAFYKLLHKKKLKK